MKTEGKTAMVAGGSGLTGSCLVQLLLQDSDYSKIILLSRHPSGINHEKLDERIIDFNNLRNSIGDMKADNVFCCLGTTMKNAGSKEAFRKVDHDYVVEFAGIMCENGANQFIVISSMGADVNSSIFYNRVKGEMEMAVKNIPFPVIHILRPSLLLGKRNEKRTGERLAIFFFKIFGFLMMGSLKKYRAIEASTVARAMVRIAQTRGDGIFIYESEMIRKI